MAYLGLVLSSLGFLVPGWVAWRRLRRARQDAEDKKNKKGLLDVCTSVVISTSSLLYHGTLHPLAQRVDVYLAHGLGCLSVGRSVKNLVAWRRGWVEAGITGGTLGSIGIYLFKSRVNPHPNSKYWHVLFHLTGQATWVAHVLTA